MPAIVQEKKRGTPRLPKPKAPVAARQKPETEAASPGTSAVQGASTDFAKRTQISDGMIPTIAAPALQRKLITVKHAAFLLGKSEDAIYRWLRTGRLKGFQPGGSRCWILVDESSVEELIRNSAIAESQVAQIRNA